MVRKKLWKRLLDELFGVQHEAFSTRPPAITGYSLSRRACAEAIGVALPLHTRKTAATQRSLATISSLPRVTAQTSDSEHNSMGSLILMRVPPALTGIRAAKSSAAEDEQQADDLPQVMAFDSDGRSLVYSPFKNDVLVTATVDSTVIDADAGKLSFELIRLHSVGEPASTDLLICLYRSGSHWSGTAVIPALLVFHHLIAVAEPVSALDEVPAEQITRSVRASFAAAGRNAWRLIATDLATKAPVRQAIIAGLE
ncbi:hypothetical protein ACFWU5_26780 [Nocardia sp. NPDC058640]|uniref:hypothetical protein n=1 Tax=Nocardia sp. NPDC058640 TaxID=3346571 RepID=UPI0036603A4F